MSNTGDFLKGFLGTAADINIEKNKEERLKQIKADERASQYADELSMLKQKISLTKQATLETDEAKIKAKARAEQEKYNSVIQSNPDAFGTNNSSDSSTGPTDVSKLYKQQEAFLKAGMTDQAKSVQAKIDGHKYGQEYLDNLMTTSTRKVISELTSPEDTKKPYTLLESGTEFSATKTKEEFILHYGGERNFQEELNKSSTPLVDNGDGTYTLRYRVDATGRAPTMLENDFTDFTRNSGARVVDGLAYFGKDIQGSKDQRSSKALAYSIAMERAANTITYEASMADKQKALTNMVNIFNRQYPELVTRDDQGNIIKSKALEKILTEYSPIAEDKDRISAILDVKRKSSQPQPTTDIPVGQPQDSGGVTKDMVIANLLRAIQRDPENKDKYLEGARRKYGITQVDIDIYNKPDVVID